MDQLARLYGSRARAAYEDDECDCDDECGYEEDARCCEGPDDCDCYECDEPPRRRDIFDDFDDSFNDVLGDFDKGFDDIFDL